MNKLINNEKKKLKNEEKKYEVIIEANINKNKYGNKNENGDENVDENEIIKDKSLSNSIELSSNKAINGESFLFETVENQSNIVDAHAKYLDDITKDTQKYIIPNKNNSNHDFSHFTNKIVQKFKSELSLKKSKKSFMSLKAKSSQSVILSPSISVSEISIAPSTPKSSIHISINQLNIDNISQNQKSKAKSCCIEMKKKISKISLSDKNIWEILRSKNQRKIIIDSTESNQNNLITNCTVDRIIPSLLTSNTENINYIIHSFNNNKKNNSSK